MRVCDIEGCENKHHARGYCMTHYTRFQRHGSPYKVIKELNKPVTYYVDENGCHICDSHPVGTSGYQRIQRNNVTDGIPRYIYKQTHGEIPVGLMVRHKCDVRTCINLDHLELGTHEDNMRDMRERGRQNYGERYVLAKLTDEKVIAIRSEIKPYTHQSLADKYNVSRQTITGVLNRRSWKHI